MSDHLTRSAYKAWRSAQRGHEVPDAEFEATYSRLEGEWMSQVVAAVREQIAADIEVLQERGYQDDEGLILTASRIARGDS